MILVLQLICFHIIHDSFEYRSQFPCIDVFFSCLYQGLDGSDFNELSQTNWGLLEIQFSSIVFMWNIINRSVRWNVWSAECGVRSAECGVRSAECGVRSAECGVRSAECGVRSAVTSELNNLTCWLRANKLILNVAKTELMIIGSRQRLNAQCEEIDISIDDRTIKRVDHTKSLGLTIDAQLSWSKHVDEISKKVSSAIGALKRVRPFIPTDVAVQIYNALILPHFDYCSPVWDGLSGCLSDKLQKLQNRAARVITQSPFDTSSNLLLTMLKWEKLSLRRKKQKALIMYKTLNELAPDYLQCLFTQRHVNDYNLRNLEGKLSLPKPNNNYLKRSFCYSGACLWNNLPQELKSVCSIGQFNRGIKKVSETSDSHTAIM